MWFQGQTAQPWVVDNSRNRRKIYLPNFLSRGELATTRTELAAIAPPAITQWPAQPGPGHCPLRSALRRRWPRLFPSPWQRTKAHVPSMRDAPSAVLASAVSCIELLCIIVDGVWRAQPPPPIGHESETCLHLQCHGGGQLNPSSSRLAQPCSCPLVPGRPQVETTPHPRTVIPIPAVEAIPPVISTA